MLKIVVIILIFIVVAFFFFKSSSPEANTWLEENQNKHALAGNRFAGTEDAISFVNKLYDLGAVKVVISSDSIYKDKDRIEKEGGPYADAIVVTMPSSESQKAALFEIFKQEAISQGIEFNSETDVKNNKVFIWWD
ncbi:hypothetical protein [Pseudoalteromonas aurantia]|uniref:Uncharacterized protein n=1 Tax=Pseudoalteromonas aurantia 208 TaxID=1314867 RepID=A0ABR9ECG9_9GAMM|nr:hypothetical protein [Pseudoalteromonas aurantia]MBE0368683.1 hypothetical protein [Pseudoalteromonas aurantia 208]